MAKYTSQYPALGFYVNDELKRFNNGQYATDDNATIVVLDGLTDVKRVDAPKATKPEAEKPAPAKAPATRKASAK